MANDITFSVKNLTKIYPGVVALDNISLEFKPGTIHALVGENGAGKSTLIKCLAGAIVPTSGTVRIGNRSYNALTPQLAQDLGISVIYQEFNQVPSMSAAENVFLGAKTGSSKLINIKERERLAAELFAQLKVNINPSSLVRDLSPACQQIIEIAKAIRRNVKLLIMDEPTAPLTIKEVGTLFDIVRTLKEKGVTIVYISHRLEEIFAIADTVSVLRDGKLIATKRVADTNRKELISYIAGREISSVYPYHEKHAEEEEVLRLEHVSGNGLKDVSFAAHRSEILGFAGLVGAGRTELMEMIYGSVPAVSGKIIKNGNVLRLKEPKDALSNGIGLIPEDRKRLGIFLDQSVQWNCSINCIRDISKRGVVNEGREKELAHKFCEAMEIKTPTLQQTAKNLSGGNQQKVVIAKTLAVQTDVVIFDEPTRGIDVGAKQEIYMLINQLADEGKALLMVSSDLPELMGICDRIAIICEGRLVGIIPREKFDQNRILDLASGGSAEQ